MTHFSLLSYRNAKCFLFTLENSLDARRVVVSNLFAYCRQITFTLQSMFEDPDFANGSARVQNVE